MVIVLGLFVAGLSASLGYADSLPSTIESTRELSPIIASFAPIVGGTDGAAVSQDAQQAPSMPAATGLVTTGSSDEPAWTPNCSRAAKTSFGERPF
jgi:hypothetical protein